MKVRSSTQRIYVGNKMKLIVVLRFQLVLVGLILTTLGYLTGWFSGFFYRQEYEDCLAIANESIIQSSGKNPLKCFTSFPHILLFFSLKLSTVCATVLVLTSLPMILQFAWNKIKYIFNLY